MMDKSSPSTLLLCLFFFLFLCLSSSSKVHTVFLFGDSILDAGNNVYNKNCSIQANFPPYGQDFFHHPTGRFTNGRTVPDFIAEAVGIDLQKPYMEVDMLVKSGELKEYPVNGINFASAGSGVLRQTNEMMGVIPLQVQLQQFESLVMENKIDKQIIEQALYVFETGSNDVFFYFFPTGNQQPDPDTYTTNMLSEIGRVIQRVHELGARRIVLFGLGPVGCIPARLNLPGAVVEQCYSQINEMVEKYNLGLEAMVDEMPTKLKGSVGAYAATFDVVQRFLHFPQQYGFFNVSSACCGDGTLRGIFQCGTGQYELCDNPGQYLFWDYFHPTEHAYSLLFQAFWNGKAPQIRPFNLRTLVDLTIPKT